MLAPPALLGLEVDALRFGPRLFPAFPDFFSSFLGSVCCVCGWGCATGSSGMSFVN